jgi:uncharacterized membrane protein YadS
VPAPLRAFAPSAVRPPSPLLRARHAETAFAVTCVVLFGCIAMLHLVI